MPTASRSRTTRRPPDALAGEARRPDAGQGVLETLLARDGAAVDAEAHLARLAHSVAVLYGQELPRDLAERLDAAARGDAPRRLRVLAAPGPVEVAEVELEGQALPARAPHDPVSLSPAVLPGGLGAHKWRDRRLLAELEGRLGAVPLLTDVDGEVLEAAWANVFVVEGSRLITPPLDGRQLPGTVRARLLDLAPAAGLEPCEEPLSLDRLAEAHELLLSSSVQGVRPAVLSGERSARFDAGARLQDALMGRPRPVEPQ